MWSHQKHSIVQGKLLKNKCMKKIYICIWRKNYRGLLFNNSTLNINFFSGGGTLKMLGAEFHLKGAKPSSPPPLFYASFDMLSIDH